jgi:hypothetical protein
MLLKGGYELLNPCRIIIAEHWHCGPKEHSGRHRVDTLVDDLEIKKNMFSQVIRWGVKPKPTTKFVWVGRHEENM